MNSKPYFRGYFSSSQGDVKGKVYFSVGELNLIEMLQEDFNITYLEAVDQVIKYKREQVLYYRQQGNNKLADQLLEELGEI
jgi:hypothetical protein